MKPPSLILPVTALILAGCWVGVLRRSKAGLEAECDRLQSQIAAMKAPPLASASPLDPAAKHRKAIEWRRIAGHFQNRMQSGALLDMRVAMRFRQRMEAMDAGEIIATLEEVAVLGLPDEARGDLERTLLESLIQKDPELALERFVDRAGSGEHWLGFLLSGALQAWAARDSEAADAWFDRQIAAGNFESKALDGVSNPRQMFESSIISALLASSPEAAARRLAGLPEDQRGNVMHMYFLTTVPEETQVVHAQLVRARVAAEDRAGTIASQASLLFRPGDYSAVTAYLERIDATPDERTACAMKAVQNMNPKIPGSNHLTREDFDSLREWVGIQAPELIETITGKALGEAAQGNRKMSFAAAAELAVDYGASDGAEEALAAFLTSWAASSNKEAARALAEKIADEGRRAEVMEFLK